MAVALVLAGCGPTFTGPARYRPRQPEAPGYSLEGDRLTFEAAGLKLAVRVIEDAERARMLRNLAGLEVDPFALARNGKPVFFTLLFELENVGRQTVFFNPTFVTLQATMQNMYPRSVPELWTYLTRVVEEEGAEALTRVVYDSTLGIPPGKRAVRLLVFNAPEDRPAGMKLGVGPIAAEQGDVLAVFPLRDTARK
jgi:hypothetical protein